MIDQSALKSLLPKGQTLRALDKLFGEASYREYFRVQTEPKQSYILMKLPAGKQSASEEITHEPEPHDELPFLNIAHFLAASGLAVPQIVGTQLQDGLILLEDLGDQNLESVVQNSNESLRLFFYKQALDLLLKFQKAGEANQDPTCIAFQRSFDERLLLWEFEHFLEYGIEARFSLQIPQAKRARLMEWGRELIRPIPQLPYGLTHRDFQSRNLMLHGYEFYLIDFQDALLGPPHYDLVALLRDSYVELPWEQVELLIEVYLKGRKALGLPELEQEEFRKDFHRITLQRKLKDAGRFQYIHTVKGNSKFLVHVPTTLKYIQSAFSYLPELGELRELLAEYVKELA